MSIISLYFDKSLQIYEKRPIYYSFVTLCMMLTQLIPNIDLQPIICPVFFIYGMLAIFKEKNINPHMYYGLYLIFIKIWAILSVIYSILYYITQYQFGIYPTLTLFLLIMSVYVKGYELFTQENIRLMFIMFIFCWIINVLGLIMIFVGILITIPVNAFIYTIFFAEKVLNIN